MVLTAMLWGICGILVMVIAGVWIYWARIEKREMAAWDAKRLIENEKAERVIEHNENL